MVDLKLRNDRVWRNNYYIDTALVRLFLTMPDGQP